MRKKFSIAVLAVTMIVVTQLRADGPSAVQSVAWLAGCWTMTSDAGVTEETWLPPSGDVMLGVSRTIRDGATRAYEFIAIRQEEGKTAYVAIPSGQPQASFPLVRSSSTELVFENPQHDFPQRVIYRKTYDGLAARIEGRVDGQLQSVDFPYRRCPASGGR